MTLACGLVAAAQGAKRPTLRAPQIPLIKISTTIVEVPVLVLNKQGQPMQELRLSDFSIFDDGRLQHISGFDHSPRPVSLAIVVDTYDWNAIDQAKRAAQLISAMVVGAQGEASIYVPGPQARCVLAFTSDTSRIADVLQHLNLSPAAPQGAGSIMDPLNLAMLALRHQPRSRTRAALVISSSNSKGEGAEAVLDSGMSDAIPVFRIRPNQPANAPQHINPDTPELRGYGQGSQREQAPAAPMDSRGQPTTGNGDFGLNLAPIITGAAGLAAKVLMPHYLNYVFYSGGVSYNPGNDHQFDQRLSLIGQELRSYYHLFYSPNDLTPTARLHAINVYLDLPATSGLGHVSYRRTYVGVQPH
ncbi:MAG: VWA domain-containing protein [Terriglobales bacterium]